MSVLFTVAKSFSVMLLAALIIAAAGPPDKQSAPETGAGLASQLQFREITPGVFALGKVTLNKARRTVSFPAVVNQRAGMVEYAVVTLTGKTHESVFKTEVRPDQIHTALLLLGANPASTNMFPRDPSEPLPGDKVTIEVTWEQDGHDFRKPLESFIITTNNQKSLSPGPWIYNGSYLLGSRFMAQVEGSIISVHTDPVALVNNPRKGRENDDMQNVNTAALPPNDLPLQVVIKLEAENPSVPSQKSSARPGDQPVPPRRKPPP